MKTLQDWFQTPLGRLLAAFERRALEKHLDRWAGRRLLQVGGFGAGHSVVRANTSRRWLVGRDRHEASDCVLRPEQLPFQSGSMDIVVLVHSLEFSDSPHRVLREANRVLAPEGRLLLLGFNPLSLWGLAHKLPALRRRGAPWNGHYFTSRRLRDWLTLLELETVSVEHHFYRPPLNRSPLQRRLRPLERWAPRLAPWFGAVHLTIAQKHVAGIAPIRPILRQRRRLVAGGLAQPTSRKPLDVALRRDL